MVLHVVTITWGYAAGGSLRTPGDAVGARRSTTPACCSPRPARSCLVMVVVTSVRGGAAAAALRVVAPDAPLRLPRRRPGAAPPALDRRSSSPARRRRTVFWWTAWALAVAAVLVWRVGRPLARQPAAPAARDLGRTTRATASGRSTSPAATSTGCVSRPASSSAGGSSAGTGLDPRQPLLALGRPRRDAACASRSRPSATAAPRPASCDPGTRALVEGPYGRLSARARTRPRVRCIGAGVGVTPLRALAEGLAYAPGEARPARALHRRAAVRAPRSTCCRAHRGLQVAAPARAPTPPGVLAGRRHGARSTTSRALRYWVPDVAERDVYVCGPEHWTDLVRRTLDAAGVPPDHLHLETFAW